MEAPVPSGPEKITYKGKIIEVVEQPMKIGDRERVFEFARRSPGVRLIVPTSDGDILLTKEYRPELKTYDYRLPGGKVIDTLEEYNAFLKTGADLGQKAYEAAQREAREEIGIIIEEAELLGISRCGLTVEWDLYYFVVNTYKKGVQELEEGEDITVVPTKIADAKAMCLDGRVQEDRSALMLLRYLNK